MVTDDPRIRVREKYGARPASEFDRNTPITFSMSLEGLEGTGKTHFAVMTMPLPLVFVNFGDRPVTPFLYMLSPERAKYVIPYDIQPSTEEGWTFQEATKSLQALGEIIKAEAPRMRGGSFVLDGGSSWWSAMQRVFVEPKEQARLAAGQKSMGGLIYAEANDRVRGILGYLKSYGCFLAITHQMAQDWDASGPIPGSYSARRNSQIAGAVEVIIEFEKRCSVCNAPSCKTRDHTGRKHFARLVKFAGNTAMEGLVIENPDFAKVYALYTGKQFEQPPLPENF